MKTLDLGKREAAEARALAARLERLLSGGEIAARDVVLLTRATTDLRVYERALEERGIPTYVIGGAATGPTRR